ncbi:hypothetical protein [Sedimenticola selenatireducens]|uniref:hypothetical protein n=1 Tax=Sedimenticola selenatireducens TaxID=191960 RepID=UPI000490D379|nr:hypothetical protein [Sedimenticola selenatireducens]
MDKQGQQEISQQNEGNGNYAAGRDIVINQVNEKSCPKPLNECTPDELIAERVHTKKILKDARKAIFLSWQLAAVTAGLIVYAVCALYLPIGYTGMWLATVFFFVFPAFFLVWLVQREGEVIRDQLLKLNLIHRLLRGYGVR